MAARRADVSGQRLRELERLGMLPAVVHPDGSVACPERHRVHHPAAPTRTVYEVWVGTENTKERIVKETTDIEEAASLACADLSGCTFWGMKAPSRTEAEQSVLPPFKTAWARKRSEGYQYGGDALENVRFGYEIAVAELARRGLK